MEKLLSQPTLDMFDLPLSQVYSLLKFDCYPRFLRSEVYRDYCNGNLPLPQYEETSDSDQDSVKSHKLDQDGRRRSLLPWNIKNRTKNKHKNKVLLMFRRILPNKYFFTLHLEILSRRHFRRFSGYSAYIKVC